MKKRNIKYYLILFSLALSGLLQACIDPFTLALDSEDAESILVVEALITDKPGSFEVKLSRSVPIDTIVSFESESGAVVSISDDHENTYELFETEPGIYRCLEKDVKAVTGRNYVLSIIDSNSKEYESTAVLMEETPEVEDLKWKEITETVILDNEVFEQLVIEILVDTDDPTLQTKYYKWDINETWEVFMPDKITALDGKGTPYEAFVVVPKEKKQCWVTRKSENILVKSVDNQQDSKVEDFVIKKIGPGEDKLFVRYSIEVEQYTLNQEMYEFWDKLKEFNEEAGSLYDRVPLSIFGNISCCDGEAQVLGYFHAAEVKTKRIFIERGQHNVNSVNDYEGCLYVTEPTMHPFVRPFNARSAFCSDCRNYGSNEKPDFW